MFVRFAVVSLFNIYNKLLRYYRLFIIWFLVYSPYIPSFTNIINQSDIADNYKPNDRFKIVSVVLASEFGFNNIYKIFLALDKFGILDGGTIYAVISRRFLVSTFEIIVDFTKLGNAPNSELRTYKFTDGVYAGNFGIFPIFA